MVRQAKEEEFHTREIAKRGTSIQQLAGCLAWMPIDSLARHQKKIFHTEITKIAKGGTSIQQLAGYWA